MKQSCSALPFVYVLNPLKNFMLDANENKTPSRLIHVYQGFFLGLFDMPVNNELILTMLNARLKDVFEWQTKKM